MKNSILLMLSKKGNFESEEIASILEVDEADVLKMLNLLTDQKKVKLNKDQFESLLFFIPEGFVPYLEQYLNNLDLLQ
ncbi:MAG: hypothetical protein R6U96_06860 [Promethearchaeia archaeon]